MPKKKVTADELIWLFHEKLAGTNMSKVRIAIVPSSNGSWSTLTSPVERRCYPELATAVSRIEKQLRGRYSLKES